MDRIEATYLLNNLRAFGKDDSDDEAIDMAIEALQEKTGRSDQRGEWIVGTTKDFLFPDQYTNVYQCDQCGAIEWRNTNYCPSCGAEMKSCDDE